MASHLSRWTETPTFQIFQILFHLRILGLALISRGLPLNVHGLSLISQNSTWLKILSLHLVLQNKKTTNKLLLKDETIDNPSDKVIKTCLFMSLSGH